MPKSLSTSNLESVAHRILAAEPDPSVVLWIQEEVLQAPLHHPGTRAARRDLLLTANVRKLEACHSPGHGWGRFHSADSKSAQLIPTTEHGVRRAIALRLLPSWPVLSDVATHCEALLNGKDPFPDPPERNDRWETAWRLFVASTLSLIRPRSKLVQRASTTWRTILEAAFDAGKYDAEAESDAHRRLTGATVRGSYLQLDNRYAVELLAANAHEIPNRLCAAYVTWLSHRPGGLRYLGAPPLNPARLGKPNAFDRWLSTWGLLSRYPGWEEWADPAMRWLWSQRVSERGWDFGARPTPSYTMPLSDGWAARRNARTTDWSTWALVLLARYCRCENRDRNDRSYRLRSP